MIVFQLSLSQTAGETKEIGANRESGAKNANISHTSPSHLNEKDAMKSEIWYEVMLEI
jgi:hypothetical protein